MSIKYACLIPCTRPQTVDLAMASAIKYGWTPIVLEDNNQEGVCKTRMLQDIIEVRKVVNI